MSVYQALIDVQVELKNIEELYNRVMSMAELLNSPAIFHKMEHVQDIITECHDILKWLLDNADELDNTPEFSSGDPAHRLFVQTYQERIDTLNDKLIYVLDELDNVIKDIKQLRSRYM